MSTTQEKPKPAPLSFSHIGIHVRDLDRMTDFYTRVLGFTETDRGTARGLPIVFTSWDAREHHQMVLVGGRPDESGYNHINQMSFRVPDLEDVLATWRRIKDEPGVSDIVGTNHGNAWSVYFRDPEGNRIEIFADSPWYVSQPCITPLELDKPAADIRAASEAWCRAQPSFKPVAEYQQETAALIARHQASL